MEELHDKKILIGREPGKNRLQIAINTNNGIKVAAIGEPNSVPMSVSRCIPIDNSAHCRLEISNTGSIRLVNIKEENITYANGNEVQSKVVNENCTIALGREMYSVEMKKILDTAKEMLTSKQPQAQQPSQQQQLEFSIKPLEAVWEEHHKRTRQLLADQKRQNLIKSLYLPCSILSTLVGAFCEGLSYIMYAIAIIALIYGLYKTITDKSVAKKEKLQDWLIDNYVCPNPDCKRFMGNQPFKIIKQHKNCPYCKCKFKL